MSTAIYQQVRKYDDSSGIYSTNNGCLTPNNTGMKLVVNDKLYLFNKQKRRGISPSFYSSTSQ